MPAPPAGRRHACEGRTARRRRARSDRRRRAGASGCARASRSAASRRVSRRRLPRRRPPCRSRPLAETPAERAAHPSRRRRPRSPVARSAWRSRLRPPGESHASGRRSGWRRCGTLRARAQTPARAPITIASIRLACSRERRSGRPSAIAIATEPAISATATGYGSERRRSIGRSNRSAISAAGVKESVRLARLCSPNDRRYSAHLLPEADQQGQRTTGVERHLDRLADLGVELAVGPAQHRRHQHEVSGAGDGKQLGRSLDRAECGGVRDREPVVAQGARVSVAGFPGRLLRITKYTIIAMIPATIT